MKNAYSLIRDFMKMSLALALILVAGFANAQVNGGAPFNKNDHQKQIIAYFTQWDAWKGANNGLPAKGVFNQLNVDYSQYSIINYSFFGVAQDGSLHGGDYRNKQIYQAGQVQAPDKMINDDIYSSWDMYLLYGELEVLYYVAPGSYAASLGYVEIPGGWENTNTGATGTYPLSVPKQGGAQGLFDLTENNGVKFMASLGGWSMCKHFPEMARDDVKRAKFIADCKKLIDLGFDGIDLDWEFPGHYGMNIENNGPDDYANFERLVKEIRAAIGPDKYITAAFHGTPDVVAGFDWAELDKHMDFYNMMTYDYNGGWSDDAGHNSALYGNEFSLDKIFTYLTTQRGVNPTKINLGVAFYGRGVVTNGAADLGVATVKRPETVEPDGPITTCSDFTNWGKGVWDGTPNYHAIKQAMDAGGWTRHWDDTAKVPYLTKDNYFLSYDDEESIRLKAEYVNAKNAGGVIIWQIFGDWDLGAVTTTYGNKLPYCANAKAPLANALNEVFAQGASGDPIVNVTSPANNAVVEQETLSAVTLTANATDDGSVASVVFSVDGQTLNATASGSNYSVSWTPSAYGDFAITATATDNEGNTANASVNLTISAPLPNEAPEITASNQTASQETLSAVTLNATVSDDDAVASVEFTVNGTTIAGTAGAGDSYAGSWTPSAFGTYTVTVTATDNEGATSTTTFEMTVEEYIRNTEFKVVGYFAAWAGANEENLIEYEKYTHLNYSFAIPNTDGKLKPLENASRLATIVQNAHAVGTKVFIAVGGWSDQGEVLDSRFEAIGASPTYRQNLVNDVMALVAQYNLDGVDMDWEYPNAGASADNYEALMMAFANQLHPAGKELSAAVSALSGGEGIKTSLLTVIDHLNIMAYDGDAGAGHSPYSYAESALNYWIDQRGLPADRAILGLPMYARPSWKAYNTLLGEGASATADQFGSDYYNGTTTIAAKTQLAVQRAGGIMFWEISQDVHDNRSLLRAAYNAIVPPCASGCQPTITLNVESTVGTGTAVTLSASANDPDGGAVSVEFFVDGVSVGTDNSAPYQTSWTPATNGTYTVSATVTDDENQTASVSASVSASSCTATPWDPNANNYVGGDQVSYNGRLYEAKWWTTQTPGGTEWTDLGVCGDGNTNQKPTASVSLSASSADVNTAVTISATASDSDGSVASVEFFVNGSSVGVDNSAPYSVSWTSTTAGTYTVSAVATDNEGATSDASTASFTANSVGGGNDNPTVSLSSDINGGDLGTSIVLTASANDTDGSVSSVTFSVDGAVINTDSSAPFTYTWTPTAAGTYTVSAVATDNEGATSSLSSINITITDNELCGGIPAYAPYPTGLYQQGDQVVHNGIIYESQVNNLYNVTPGTAEHWWKTIGACSGRVEANAAVDFNVSLFPNPAVETASVRLNLDSDSQVRVAIYNTLGAKVADVINSNLSAGSHTFKVNVANLSEGLYLLKVNAGDRSVTEKIIKR